MDEAIRLTENEKKIIKELINHGRASDTKVSEAVPISQQAVQQIRSRLESLGIIKGYIPIIDFEKIGIKVLYFTGIEILPEMWEKFSEEEVNDKLLELPFLFELFRIPSADISYIAIFGFKSIKEQEEYSARIESNLSKEIRLKWSYTASVDNMIAYDSLNLVFHALSKNKTDYGKTIKKLSKK